MRFIILYTLLLFLFVLPVRASVPELKPEPQRIELNGKISKFSAMVFIRTQAGCGRYSNKIAARLKAAEVGYTFDSTLRHSATITLKIVDSISKINAINAYEITINDHHCMIVATSHLAMLWACSSFNQLCRNKREGFLKHVHYVELPCGQIADWQDKNIDGFLEVNVSDKFLFFNHLQHKLLALSKQRVSGIYIRLSDADNWRIESGISKHTSGETVSSEQFYTYDQLRRLSVITQNNGIELIPVLDLRANSRFKAATGHQIQSVEGERLVVWMIEEILCKTDFSTLCIEIPPRSRYTDKINKLVSKLQKQGIELTIHIK